jgi:Carbohydrate esterase, sialic acid-specific acetylesterase
MKVTAIFLIFWVVIIASAKEYKLFYLGGQSNMDGFGFIQDLPSELAKPIPGVYIFHGDPAPDGVSVDGKGIWEPLKPGHGSGFSSDGKINKLSDRFGVELTLAIRLQELLPGQPIAILKYSRGGTSIDTAAAGEFGCWDPDFSKGNGINQYDHFLAAIKYALSVEDIDGDGEKDILIPAGIFWMQGESDACFGKDIALKYQANLKRLMDLLRAAFRTDDLPVVIGRISDSGRNPSGKVWPEGEIVRQAQADFVRSDGNATLVTSTDKYGYSDPWHYDSAGYLDLGRQFAEAFYSLITQKL